MIIDHTSWLENMLQSLSTTGKEMVLIEDQESQTFERGKASARQDKRLQLEEEDLRFRQKLEADQAKIRDQDANIRAQAEKRASETYARNLKGDEGARAALRSRAETLAREQFGPEGSAISPERMKELGSIWEQIENTDPAVTEGLLAQWKEGASKEGSQQHAKKLADNIGMTMQSQNFQMLQDDWEARPLFQEMSGLPDLVMSGKMNPAAANQRSSEILKDVNALKSKRAMSQQGIAYIDSKLANLPDEDWAWDMVSELNSFKAQLEGGVGDPASIIKEARAYMANPFAKGDADAPVSNTDIFKAASAQEAADKRSLSPDRMGLDKRIQQNMQAAESLKRMGLPTQGLMTGEEAQIDPTTGDAKSKRIEGATTPPAATQPPQSAEAPKGPAYDKSKTWESYDEAGKTAILSKLAKFASEGHSREEVAQYAAELDIDLRTIDADTLKTLAMVIEAETKRDKKKGAKDPNTKAPEYLPTLKKR